LSIKDSIGFCLAVQWHPEWNASSDKVSKPLFQNFGENLRLPSD
jgi:putative glutamine amidotransferase